MSDVSWQTGRINCHQKLRGVFKNNELAENFLFINKISTSLLTWIQVSKMKTLFGVTPDVRQPWTNYVNNGNKYLIIGAVVSAEYSNIWYLHLIIGKVQKFVSGDKNDF